MSDDREAFQKNNIADNFKQQKLLMGTYLAKV
jgi:hypothetical protein